MDFFSSFPSGFSPSCRLLFLENRKKARFRWRRMAKHGGSSHKILLSSPYSRRKADTFGVVYPTKRRESVACFISSDFLSEKEEEGQKKGRGKEVPFVYASCESCVGRSTYSHLSCRARECKTRVVFPLVQRMTSVIAQTRGTWGRMRAAGHDLFFSGTVLVDVWILSHSTYVLAYAHLYTRLLLRDCQRHGSRIHGKRSSSSCSPRPTLV